MPWNTTDAQKSIPVRKIAKRYLFETHPQKLSSLNKYNKYIFFVLTRTMAKILGKKSNH